MDLIKSPSVQSLLDSDLESVGSLQYLDIEELDEVEYALPPSEAPSLAEILSTDEEKGGDNQSLKSVEEPLACSTLQVDFLQGISQQLIQAQERSSAGAATALSIGSHSKLTVGTAHGHILSFFEQTLRWVCDLNIDCGAVSCLSYNKDGTRLLAGYARGDIYQYESIKGIILRRITLGGGIWGTLRVTWAGSSGLALDTGGSVWLIKFSRPLGIRSARTSCLFSGARGEVVAMAARDARILALATLSRVIIVAGGRAAGMRLSGPSDTLPVLEWSETDDRLLICARAKTLYWLLLNITGSTISLRPVHRVELKTTPLWLGWLGGNIAIFDSDENLRIWGEDYDKPLDLSHIEPIYASAFFKGHWTDGRVSRAMCAAGASALGGACVVGGILSVLGRRGIVRVRTRDALARAEAFLSSGRYLQAVRLLLSVQSEEAKALANKFIINISERPYALRDKHVADQTIRLCLKYNFREELWNLLWEQCSDINTFVEALGDAAVRGELSTLSPSPDSTQALIERLAESEPTLVERVVASIPFTSLDPHRASVFTRERGLWRGVGAIAAALGGGCAAMRELAAYTQSECGEVCQCAGPALVLATADALAGRNVPEHARPSARHDALQTLLADDRSLGCRSPLRVMVEHEASSAVRLLEQSAREPPFVGPLGKQNRLRVARALLTFANDLPRAEDRTEILEFISGQIISASIPSDQEVIKDLQELAAATNNERADRTWLTLLTRAKGNNREQIDAQQSAIVERPRVQWRLDLNSDRHESALLNFFRIETPSNTDIEELFDYLRARIVAGGNMMNILEPHIARIIELEPREAASLLAEYSEDSIVSYLRSNANDKALEFAECLREEGRLRGEGAAVHLRNLCTLRAGRVRHFLSENPGLVRPEEALSLVRELGPQEAEPICLEATGDPSAALDVLLRLAASSDTEETKTRFIVEAGELCARISPTVPSADAASMWTRLFRSEVGTPPGLLLEAVAYLPVDHMLGKMCESPQVALAILACASSRREVWKSAVRITGRESHEALARALTCARRALPVRGDCPRCGLGLMGSGPVRTGHCARAYHAHCELDSRCNLCGRCIPDTVVSLPMRVSRQSIQSPPPDFTLYLMAPPRPDLEGIV